MKIHNQGQICLDWSDLLCLLKVGLHDFIKRLEMNSYDRDRAERQRKHQPCQASQLLCLIPACVSSFQNVKKGFATCAPPFTNTCPLLKTAAYTSRRFFFFMSLAEWKPKLSLPVTRSQRATSRPTPREKFSLNFSGSSFVIRVNPLHPCSFMVY